MKKKGVTQRFEEEEEENKKEQELQSFAVLLQELSDVRLQTEKLHQELKTGLVDAAISTTKIGAANAKQQISAEKIKFKVKDVVRHQTNMFGQPHAAVFNTLPTRTVEELASTINDLAIALDQNETAISALSNQLEIFDAAQQQLIDNDKRITKIERAAAQAKQAQLQTELLAKAKENEQLKAQIKKKETEGDQLIKQNATKDDLINDLETQVAALTTAGNKLGRKAEQLQDELQAKQEQIDLEKNKLQRQERVIVRLNQAIADGEAKQEELTAALELRDTQQQRLESEIQAMQEESHKARAIINDKNQVIARVSALLQTAQNTIVDLQRDNQSLKHNLNQERQQKNELGVQLEAAHANAQQTAKHLDLVQQQLRVDQTQLAIDQQTIARLEKKVLDGAEVNENLQGQIVHLRITIEQFAAREKTHQEDEQNLRRRLDEAYHNINDLEQAIARLDEMLINAGQQIVNLEQQNLDLTHERDAAKQTVIELQAQLVLNQQSQEKERREAARMEAKHVLEAKEKARQALAARELDDQLQLLIKAVDDTKRNAQTQIDAYHTFKQNIHPLNATSNKQENSNRYNRSVELQQNNHQAAGDVEAVILPLENFLNVNSARLLPTQQEPAQRSIDHARLTATEAHSTASQARDDVAHFKRLKGR